jgi:hypothetical protein
MKVKRLLPFLILCIAITAQPAVNAQSHFGGYRCTKDCSGHKAGYDWAKKKDVRDPKDCASKSQSFTEGCLVYVEEKNRGK